MTDPTDLAKFKKRKLKQRGRATTLCKSGFHKWAFEDQKQFDVKQGRLISIEKCTRCGTTRTSISE